MSWETRISVLRETSCTRFLLSMSCSSIVMYGVLAAALLDIVPFNDRTCRSMRESASSGFMSSLVSAMIDLALVTPTLNSSCSSSGSPLRKITCEFLRFRRLSLLSIAPCRIDSISSLGRSDRTTIVPPPTLSNAITSSSMMLRHLSLNPRISVCPCSSTLLLPLRKSSTCSDTDSVINPTINAKTTSPPTVIASAMARRPGLSAFTCVPGSAT
mmetsp:Transcript_34509/g.77816  ORF Transcript_34509/g.77816 Transcript_34509/m.77816 type:complete len:214 (-) Transcript_34509:892-1533(-)